ncbi:MAG: sodium-dependent transporter [Xanthomonadales bacterium]|nr:sodium-dependent transporter [Xanthomonadales bacterium]
MATVSQHGMWSSKLGFLLAAIGSAVGLGNIWRFSTVTAEHGGGAFVLIYLAAIALVGLPVMIAEVLIGRAGRESPINSLLDLARESRAWRAWSLIGWSGLTAGVLILSFYCIIAGWTLSYAVTYLSGLFSDGPAVSDAGAHFGALTSSTSQLLFWHFLFVALTVFVVARGVEKGIEAAVRFMIPALFLLLITLVIYGMTTGQFMHTLSYLFKPDFSKVTGQTLIAALGQAFFSLSLGMAGLMAYGAYVPDKLSLPRLCGIICLADTSVALLAGLAIFPVVFAFSLDPASYGPGLVFVALPTAFAQMAWGDLYGLAFFVLLAFAAWSSTISLVEGGTAYLVEKGIRRPLAATLLGGGAGVLGIASVLSFTHWSEVRVFGRNILDAVNFVASDLLLPLGGLSIAIFAGWILLESRRREQLADLGTGSYAIWKVLTRFVAPVLIALVFLSGAGLI